MLNHILMKKYTKLAKNKQNFRILTGIILILRSMRLMLSQKIGSCFDLYYMRIK
jgi:hypothetical protein